MPEPPTPALVRQMVAADHLLPGNSTARQIALLAFVAENHGCSVRHVAEALRTHKPAVTRACDRLTSVGLIHRAVDGDDRRSTSLTITASGRVALRRILEGRA